MNTALTVIIALGVIIASLVFLGSSVCAFSGAVENGGRVWGAVIALVSLCSAIVGVMQIARLNRKP